MYLKKAVAQAAIVTALTGGALGSGIAPASADPDWEPGRDHEWVDNNRGDRWRNNDNDWNNQWRHENWNNQAGWKDWDDRQEWKRWNNHDWDKWWRVHKWRHDDRPPWGWGAPPPVYWHGHAPEWIDYWGFRVFPIWLPHIKVFGFWLFGVFIPVFII
jgi:hypothetical protein